MKKFKEICYRRWDFILYKDFNCNIFTVAFMDQIDYNRSFLFQNDEIEISASFFKQLSENIRNNYLRYEDREIKHHILFSNSNDKDVIIYE